MAPALSVGLEVANPGLDGSASFGGGFVLYDDINLGLDAEGRLRSGFVTCARAHALG